MYAPLPANDYRVLLGLYCGLEHGTVTGWEVQNDLTLFYLTEGIRLEDLKPLLQSDLGSPNLAHSTQRLIRDLEMVLSPSQAHGPTDNSR